MIIEKSNTAQQLIDRLSMKAPKVGYLSPDLVASALLQIEHHGIPNAKHEDYKYCNIDAILKKEFKNLNQTFVTPGSINKYGIEGAIRLVIENGVFAPSKSDKLPQGLIVSDLDHLDAEAAALIGTAAAVQGDSFKAINAAFCNGGIAIRVPRQVNVEQPVHLLFIHASESEAWINPRTLIILEEGASATFIEQQVNAGDQKVFCNYVAEKFVAPRARLTTYTLQSDKASSYSVNTNETRVQKEGYYHNVTVTLGGSLVRNNHNVSLEGERCEAHLYGLFSADGAMLVDNHTLVDHRVPHCESNELYKGLANGKSTGVFNGKIYVQRDAQKTNAYQSSKNILLSDDASINTKPQLEIYADDVKCSHGTSTGKVDEEALFYLKSRGIGEASARKLLLASFAGEVFNQIEFESLREKASTLFGEGLAL